MLLMRLHRWVRESVTLHWLTSQEGVLRGSPGGDPRSTCVCVRPDMGREWLPFGAVWVPIWDCELSC